MLTCLSECGSQIATYLIKQYTTNTYTHVVNTLSWYLRLLITVVHAEIGIKTSESPRPLEGVAGGFERNKQTKTPTASQERSWKECRGTVTQLSGQQNEI